MRLNIDYSKKQELILLYQNSEYKKALDLAKLILHEDPNNGFIYQIIGKIYFSLGEMRNAILNFDKAIRLDPSCDQNYNFIAVSLSNIGDEDRAIKYLKESLITNGKKAQTYFNIGSLYKKKQIWDKALENLINSVSIKPYYPDAYNEIGKIFYELSEYENAIHSYKRAIKQKKNFDDAYHNLGNSYSAVGKYYDAISSYKFAFKINPKRNDSLHCIGLTSYEICDYNNGIKYFKELLKKNENDHFAKRNLAIGLMRQSYISDAIMLFEEVLLNLPDCTTCLSSLLELSAFRKNCDVNEIIKKIFNIIAKNSKINGQFPKDILSLLGFGRSGSLFLHSLFDGHPEISTLPGYFFKGWFNKKTWELLSPDFQLNNWKDVLAEKICNYFEPLFDASSKKNVIGRPNGHTKWFARNLGFTQLGDDQSEILKLDQFLFKKCFIKLLQSHKEINNKNCFELVHQAFELAYRNSNGEMKPEKTIFYHIHNPSYFERLNFNFHYPNNKSLFIVRHPIQMLESWIMHDINKLPKLLKTSSTFAKKVEYNDIFQTNNKIPHTLRYFLNPLNGLSSVKGVKLEDIKNNPKLSLSKITKWLKINNDPSIYKSEFMGKKFSRPSVNFDNITGFDKRSIDTPLGRIFSKRDILILETLFWPFMNLYKYTKMTKKDFLKNLKIIKPFLVEPFEFEMDIYKRLPKEKKELQDIESFQSCHRYLIQVWEILDNTKTYPYLIKPLK